MESGKRKVRQNIEAFVDGWQAYCAGMGLGANPYKRFSEQWKYWKVVWLESEESDKAGKMPGSYKDLPAWKYRKRHNI